MVTTLATIWLFGVDTWKAFFGSLELARTVVVEQGAAGFEKIQSVFAGVRLLGGSISVAYTVQTVVTGCVLAAHGIECGFAPYEKSILALGFVTPLIARLIAMAIGLPFGATATIALYVFAVLRAAPATRLRGAPALANP